MITNYRGVCIMSYGLSWTVDWYSCHNKQSTQSIHFCWKIFHILKKVALQGISICWNTWFCEHFLPLKIHLQTINLFKVCVQLAAEDAEGGESIVAIRHCFVNASYVKHPTEHHVVSAFISRKQHKQMALTLELKVLVGFPRNISLIKRSQDN